MVLGVTINGTWISVLGSVVSQTLNSAQLIKGSLF